MKTGSETQTQPRYDLYIVTENLEDDGGGHLNASFSASESEEKLRVEITDETVGDRVILENNNEVIKDQNTTIHIRTLTPKKPTYQIKILDCLPFSSQECLQRL